MSASKTKTRAKTSDQFSETELRVLNHFRRYLMTPGDMLCLSAQEVDSMSSGLDSLIEKRMLDQEAMRGAYCLTSIGFKAMRVTTPAN